MYINSDFCTRIFSHESERFFFFLRNCPDSCSTHIIFGCMLERHADVSMQ